MTTLKFHTLLDDSSQSQARWPMYVDGQWVEATSGAWDPVTCPARGEQLLAEVPRGTAEDVQRAVEAAQRALPAWRALHFKDRGAALLKCADAIEANAEELSRLTAQDTGNALATQARPETQTIANLFRYFGGVAGEFKGTVLPAGDDQLQYTRREPLGVVGAILPWNSPLMIAGMKIPAALAAGNTMVVKPAEDAPLTILRLIEIIAEFLPAGVLNIVTGDGPSVGQAIVDHPEIHKVSFTGSTEVGLMVGASAGGRLAHTSLELGGKSPNIVFPSAADEKVIDQTVEGVALAMRFTRQGQSCTAGSRLFVHADVYDTFMDKLVERVRRFKVGDPLAEDTEMGAIINQSQYDQIRDYVREAREQEGAQVLLDGSETAFEGLDGYYQGPTIIGGVDNSWRIAREEVFGPVLVAIKWNDLDEVIAMANDSHYGLAAFVWSQDLDEALSTAHRIESGWVQVNQGGGQVIGQSYGGYKQSGIGREFSIEGALDAFSQIKQINVKVKSLG